MFCDRSSCALCVPPLCCLEPARLGRYDELPSPLSAYAPEYREFSVGDEATEGMEDVEIRPSLEGADISVTAGCVSPSPARCAHGHWSWLQRASSVDYNAYTVD